MYFDICNSILYLEMQKNSNKMDKQIVQQKAQPKMHNNYVALLIKWFVFTKLVESLY